MENEPRGKVGSFFDITRITWMFWHQLSEALKCIKVKYWGDFLHIIILTKFQKNCSKFQNCDLRKFHDLPKFYIIIIVFRRLNVRRGFLEILFLPKIQKKNLTKRSLYHTTDITKFQTLQRIQSSPIL